MILVTWATLNFLTKAQILFLIILKKKSVTKDVCGIKQEPYTIELSLLDVGTRVLN